MDRIHRYDNLEKTQKMMQSEINGNIKHKNGTRTDVLKISSKAINKAGVNESEQNSGTIHTKIYGSFRTFLYRYGRLILILL